MCLELQQIMVHWDCVWSPAASKRAGRRHSHQPQSSWWFFQKSKLQNKTQMLIAAYIFLSYDTNIGGHLCVSFSRPNISQLG